MNRDPRFLRARIRHELLPFLEARFEPRLVPLLGRSADLTRTLVADLDRRAAQVLDRAGRSTAAGLVISVATLGGVSAELATEIVRLAAVRAGAAPGLRAPSLRAIARAVDPVTTAARTQLGHLAIERSGRWIRVGPRRLPALGEHVWCVPGCLALSAIGASLEARLFSRPAGYMPPRDARRVAFDAAGMPPALVVRARRRGDRFSPFGAPGSRRLKSFLLDAGVPRWERDRIPLMEAAGEIAWVVGLRRGRVAPITPETHRILEVTVHGPVAAVSARE
jgi:tRNA(Ile)-lysidine synthase